MSEKDRPSARFRLCTDDKYQMRYHQIETHRYFATAGHKIVGELNASNANIGLCDQHVELCLEQHRPGDRPRRAGSILVHRHPVALQDFCYRVQPLDRVDRYHTGWLILLQGQSQGGLIAHYAVLFWKGIECPEHRSEPWELRTTSAEVVQQVGGSSRDAWVPPKSHM